MSASDTRPDKVTVTWLQCLGLSKKYAEAVAATHNEQMSAKERECAALAKALEELTKAGNALAKEAFIAGIVSHVEAWDTTLSRHRCQPHAKPDGRKEKEG
jgi:DNA-binding transcriptional regulator YbjK